MQNAAEYAEIIMQDEREKIVSETPTIYQDDRIERVYKFLDGAVVKYEWQEITPARRIGVEIFNHRFSLINLPQPNPLGFEIGIIKVINYPTA